MLLFYLAWFRATVKKQFYISPRDLPRPHELTNSSLLKMALRKGFGPFTRIISADLSEEKNWYVLSHRICATSPLRYFKKNVVVLAYPKEFAQVGMKSLRLIDGSIYRGKACSEMEVVASSFGLLAVLLWQHLDKNALQEDRDLSGLKEYINGLDLSCIAIEGSGEGVTSLMLREARGCPPWLVD